MKYNFPKHKLKMEFTPGTWGENEWELGEQACVDCAFYVLPDNIEYAIYKFVTRTRTGAKKCRWEVWRNGKFSNNYFNGFYEAVKQIDGYIDFNGLSGTRQNYRVYE